MSTPALPFNRTYSETAPIPSLEKGVSKVKKFAWNITGKPSEFVWLDKKHLSVDLAYQRETSNRNLIANIASDFSWVAFGALCVALRDDHYFVVDGGHRLAGVLMRDDIKDVPCLVFESPNAVVEAQAFITVNQSRRAVCSMDKYRAKLAINDQAAHCVKKAVEAIGKKVGSGGVECVGSLLLVYNEGEERFNRVIQILAALHSDRPGFDNRMVRALAALDSKLDGDIKPHQVAKLVAYGVDGLLKEMQTLSLRIGKSNPSIWADAILSVLRRRQPRQVAVMNGVSDGVGV